MKLNASFLDVIEEIVLKYEQPCRLVFFPYVVGLELQGLSRQLKTQFPHAQVQPSVDHLSYMDKLAECDLVLQSFPFGGANTTTDALDLGIPVVGLRGIHLSGQTDPLLLAGRGLGELCVDNTEDYINLALRLLRDSDYVEEIQRRLQQASPTAGMQKIGNLTAAKVLLEFWNASLH
jgi:predicted O-linked N-acetylglucosamine transferase (SPINDLY family)